MPLKQLQLRSKYTNFYLQQGTQSARSKDKILCELCVLCGKTFKTQFSNFLGGY